MHTSRKFFGKIYLKAIRDTFFPNIWNFPICDSFIQQKGKDLIFRLAGDPTLSLVPSRSGTSWSPHEENLEDGWSSYYNDSLSKQKFTACKIKDEKEETIFRFVMLFSLLKIINPFESKKHLRT